MANQTNYNKEAQQFYIKIDGQQIPVTEEVYRAYKRPDWAEHKRAKNERNGALVQVATVASKTAVNAIGKGQALFFRWISSQQMVSISLTLYISHNFSRAK